MRTTIILAGDVAALTVPARRANIEQVFLQGSLFGTTAPHVEASFEHVERTALDAMSWIDVARGWLAGSDVVFDSLAERLPWRQRRAVQMYDRVLDEPRLTAWWDASAGEVEPLPVLAEVRHVLSARYDRCFDSIGFNLYRDGHDSVAWHGDRHRHHVVEPVVAIVSVGAPRALRLRPRGGGRSHVWELGEGDLFVMGGRCQHDWEHCVPKLRHVAGPRMSITYRHDAHWNDDAVARAGRRRTGQPGSTYVP